VVLESARASFSFSCHDKAVRPVYIAFALMEAFVLAACLLPLMMTKIRFLIVPVLLTLALLQSCTATKFSKAGQTQSIQRVLLQFVRATQQRDFATSFSLVSGRWKQNTSIEQFKSDFEADATAESRLRRVRAAASLTPQVSGSRAQIVLDRTRVLKLRFENGAWRIDQLE
jgi:hypothetical protein